MKILKKGNKYNPNWIHKATCGSCNGEYEFNIRDLISVSMGEDGTSTGFRCPNEDCINFIDAPDWVRPFDARRE